MNERPFGIALIAGWFAAGAVVVVWMLVNTLQVFEAISGRIGPGRQILTAVMVLYVVGVVALIAIASGLWRERPWARGVAGFLLAATAVVAMLSATTPWPWAVAAIHVAAVVYLFRYRARSM